MIMADLDRSGLESPRHTPVMVEEILRLLDVRPGGLYVDVTVGMGGHTAALLHGCSPEGRVVGLDRDGDSLDRARQALAPYGSRVRLVHAPFSLLDQELGRLEEKPSSVDGILADLGLSSDQLLDPERGFGFDSPAPPDMRMDRKARQTALSVISELTEKELSDLLFRLGEEPLARRFARAIKQAYERGEIESASDLSRVVTRAAGPRRTGRSRRHVATRTFMALRIAVNEELDELTTLLSQAPSWLRPGGRMAVLSYHSLEDRLVKQRFLELEKPGRSVSPEQPQVRMDPVEGEYVRLTRKVVKPSEEEMRRNPRSRSARLRVLERKPIETR